MMLCELGDAGGSAPWTYPLPPAVLLLSGKGCAAAEAARAGAAALHCTRGVAC